MASEFKCLRQYMEYSQNWMLKGALNETVWSQKSWRNTRREFMTRKWGHDDKYGLYGAFAHESQEEGADLEWILEEKKNKGMICAVQDQALRTNSIKYYCRQCEETTECLQTIVSRPIQQGTNIIQNECILIDFALLWNRPS